MRKLIKKLGITEKASQIYLELLSKGEASVEQLSKSTGLQRTGIYPYINELSNLKLVTWSEGVIDKAIRITDVERIEEIALNNLDKAKKLATAVHKQMPEIKSMHKISNEEFVIQKFTGLDQIRTVLQTVYDFKTQKGYCGEFIYDDLGKKWYENHLRNMYKSNHIHDRVIFSEKSIKELSYSQLKKTTWFDEKYCNYRVKRGLNLPQGMDVYILDDRVIKIYSDSTPTCFVIKNQKYRDYESALFEAIWPTAIEIKLLNKKNGK